LALFFCFNNFSSPLKRRAKNLTQLLSMQRTREAHGVSFSSEIYDFRYLALSDARTSIRRPLATQPPKYFDKSFRQQTAFVAAAQSN
jgi:hypothetical protein